MGHGPYADIPALVAPVATGFVMAPSVGGYSVGADVAAAAAVAAAAMAAAAVAAATVWTTDAGR